MPSTLDSGDFNGDGFEDLAVGSPLAFEDLGLAHTFYGSNSGLTVEGNQVWRRGVDGLEGRQGLFGWTFAVGDFGKGPEDDLAISAPSGYDSAPGSVSVLYGSPSGLSAQAAELWSQDSSGVLGRDETGDTFGYSLAAGNFDGRPRFDDLAVGVPTEDVGGASNAGAVNVLYGALHGLTAGSDQFWTQDSVGVEDEAEPGDRFGSSLEAEDFRWRESQPHLDDLAIGVPSEDTSTITDAGAVNVLFASHCPGSALCATDDQFWTQDSPGIGGRAEPFDGFGYGLASGRFGSGRQRDLVVAIPLEDVGGAPDAGMVDVIYGSDPEGLTAEGSQVWTQNSPGARGESEEGDNFGGCGSHYLCGLGRKARWAVASFGKWPGIRARSASKG